MSEPLFPETAARISTDARPVAKAAVPGRFQLMLLLLFGISGPWFAFLIYGVGPLLDFGNKSVPTVTPQPDSPPEIERNPPVKVQPQTPPADISAYASSESALLKELQRIELEPLHGSVANLLSEAQTQAATLNVRLQQMLTNGEGQRLANIEGVRAFRIVRQQTDATSDSLRSIEVKLRNETSQATGTFSTAELNTRKSALRETERQLENSAKMIGRLNELLDGQLKKSGAISDVTLEAALGTIQADIERRIEEAVVSQLQAAETADDMELRKLDSIRLEKEISLREAEIQLEKLQKDSALQLREIESSAEESARQRDLARVEARKAMEQALPAMRGLLSPVISKGYKQPDSAQSMKVVVDPGPLSLSALMQFGALNEDKKGMETLFYLVQPGNAFGNLNDRPLGQFPKYTDEFVIQKPAVIETVRKVQRFLIEHGDAMVEAGILSR
jgi:hypothetical protein